MSVRQIAIGQIVCLDGDRSGNLARVRNAVREAKEKGADLICLPEMALLGWVNPDAHDRAHAIPGPDSQALSELAQDFQIHLSIGLAEKDADRLYDSALLIDPTGKILLKHRKINILTELMTPPYSRGDRVAITETEFGRIGLLICADTHETEILDRMEQLKPDLVLVPYGYAAKEQAWPGHGQALEKVVVNAARKIGAPVVGTNLIGEISHGPWRGMTYGGHSVAADKTGRILVNAADFDKDVRMFSLSQNL